ncbi:MAG: virulence factor SrfB, partial [Acetobacteraceae bacterium]
GLAILHAYEKATDRGASEILRAPLRELLPDRDVSAPLEYLNLKIGQTGAQGFDLLALELTAFAPRMDAVVQASLGPILADLCEVIHSFDCDWLLLSGRPSRMRAITDLILAKMPVPPHRIVGMHHYAAGSWYPFRDPAGRVKDPKTTAAVGAMLCAMAEGRLEGFLMRTSRLAMKSTARYLGRMELSGQIRRDNILLRDPDRDAPTAPGAAPPEVKFNMEFRAPVFLGFRQLDLERWPATRLYVLEYANPDNVPRLKLPLHLTIQRAEVDPESADAEEKREDFEVVEILDADQDPQHRSVVRLRLQTERSEAGYWRDTGALSVP